MTVNRDVLPQQIRLLIASAFFLLLSFACVAQYYSVDVAVDSSTTFAKVPESQPDDAAKTLKTKTEPFIDAVAGDTANLLVAIGAAPVDTHFFVASFLISFIGAPPRAPPLPRC